MVDKYFKILGLQPGANKEQIKKAYRKSAMKYHPDKENGNADKFLLIFEAYEFLSQQDFDEDSSFDEPVNSTSEAVVKRGSRKYSEAEFEEKLKSAKEKYQEKLYQEYIDDNHFYEKVTTGWKMQYFFTVTIICLLLSIIFFADNVLPVVRQQSVITYKDNAGKEPVPNRDFRYIEVDNQSVFIHSNDFIVIFNQTRVTSNKTPIFNEIVSIETKDILDRDHVILPHYSVVSSFPLVCIILLIPLLVLLYKRRTPLFIFLYITSAFIFPIIISVLLSVNNRFFALFN